MSTFRDRLAVGVPHERAVADALVGSGWQVAPFGDLLAPAVRDAITRTTSMLRYLPDLIAVHEHVDDVRLIDAKAGRSDTPNYCVEDAAVLAYTRWQMFDVDVWLVFGDMRCARAADLWRSPARVRRHGSTGVGGSRVPYSLLPKGDPCVCSLTEGFRP